MKSKAYWNRRYLLDKAGSVNTGEDFLKEKIQPLYQQALREIEEETERMYRMFADREDISLAEAKKKINRADFRKVDFAARAKGQAKRQKELRENKKHLPDRIIKSMEERHKQYEKTLSAYAKKGQISRLELLHIDIEKILLDMCDENQMNIYDFLADQYRNEYYRSVFRDQQRVGFGGEFAAVNREAVEKSVLNTYQRSNYSDTLWKHREQLSKDLRNNITVGLIRGESLEKMASRVRRRMEVSRSSAYRLVRTETAYIFEQAAMKAYQECGIEKYEYLATLDGKTSEMCRELDGKVFRLEDAMPGKNYPPMHPNCRSTTVAAFDDDAVTKRLARNGGGKYYEVPSDMNYKEWYRKHVSVADTGKDGIIKFTDAQQYAVNDYISFGAYGLNEKLRKGIALSPMEKEKVKALDSALERCPAYSGNLSRSLFFYSEEAKTEFLGQHKIGKTVAYDFYTSTTKGEIYNPDGQIQIYIQNARKGKDISGINKAENEVLYGRGQKFRVVNTKEINGVVYILMEEI